MNLYDVALLFKQQLLDKFYIINTESNILYIRTFPRNLLHLIGMQRTKELHKVKNLTVFYNDCIKQKYLKDTLKYTYQNFKDRNLVDMKISNFDKIQTAILNAPILYYTKDKNNNLGTAISVSFMIKNNNKFLTVVFKQDKETGYYVPTSIQLDQNLTYGVIPTAYKQEQITSVQMLEYSSPVVRNIIRSSR